MAYTYIETSYSKLSEIDWTQAKNLWTRGVDWFIFKAGRKWSVAPVLDAGWPLFKTKTLAYDTVTELFLQECSNRKFKENSI